MELPIYLVIKLERFESHTTQKVETCVKTNGNINLCGQTYVLTAAVDHTGLNNNSGHYKAHVKDSLSEHWFVCNDDDIHSNAEGNLECNKDIAYFVFTRENGVNPSNVSEVASSRSSTSKFQGKSPSSSPGTSAEENKRKHVIKSETLTNMARQYGKITEVESTGNKPSKEFDKFTKPSPRVFIIKVLKLVIYMLYFSYYQNSIWKVQVLRRPVCLNQEIPLFQKWFQQRNKLI